MKKGAIVLVFFLGMVCHGQIVKNFYTPVKLHSVAEMATPDSLLVFENGTIKRVAKIDLGVSYLNLTDKPTLFSGSYTDLTQKPSLFSGSYTDLTNKPSIPDDANLLHKTGDETKEGNLTISVDNYSPPSSFLTLNAKGGSGRLIAFQKQGVYIGGIDYNFTNKNYSFDVTDASGNRVNDALTIKSETDNNFIGIGTTSPTEKLDVSGNAKVSGKFITSSGDSDNWNATYGWGNHANAGYLTQHQDISGKADKTELFSGKYTDLTQKPTLFSGSYNDLDHTPTLFSGRYPDLADKPNIPDAQVNTDWDATSGVEKLKNKPTKLSEFTNDENFTTQTEIDQEHFVKPIKNLTVSNYTVTKPDYTLVTSSNGITITIPGNAETIGRMLRIVSGGTKTSLSVDVKVPGGSDIQANTNLTGVILIQYSGNTHGWIKINE